MDAIEAILKRKSIRSYLPDPIPREKLMRVLEAGRAAPSAENLQPWYFVVVTDEEKRRRITKACKLARFLRECPVIIVGCGDRRRSPRWYAIDTAIAMENMVIAATAEGLGTCWIGSFEEEKVKEILKIPENFSIISLLAVGYPSRKLDFLGSLLHILRRRKNLNKIVGFDVYGQPRGLYQSR
ncbi:MAG: nitroreductase family protein [Candidatus Hadarchaeales archaeon]